VPLALRTLTFEMCCTTFAAWRRRSGGVEHREPPPAAHPPQQLRHNEPRGDGRFERRQRSEAKTAPDGVQGRHQGGAQQAGEAPEGPPEGVLRRPEEAAAPDAGREEDVQLEHPPLGPQVHPVAEEEGTGVGARDGEPGQGEDSGAAEAGPAQEGDLLPLRQRRLRQDPAGVGADGGIALGPDGRRQGGGGRRTERRQDPDTAVAEQDADLHRDHASGHHQGGGDANRTPLRDSSSQRALVSGGPAAGPDHRPFGAPRRILGPPGVGPAEVDRPQGSRRADPPGLDPLHHSAADQRQSRPAGQRPVRRQAGGRRQQTQLVALTEGSSDDTIQKIIMYDIEV
jgi:hypothetical protein